MNKIDEIKQALAAATPGPWSPAEPDNEDTEGIILWAPVKDSPGSYTGLCEFHPDTFVKDEDVNLIAKAPEYIAYLLKELEEAKEVLRWYSAPEFYEAAYKLTDGATHVLDDCGERARAFLKGQEGEGNQRTIEVTLTNEGYKSHQINWDNVD